ncbi:MAG TPA: ABATE domain-containing protein [Ktedonosporobacter sp.]|nr:ABATE domain-containing protein [Ktedonosporobacter sp.]
MIETEQSTTQDDEPFLFRGENLALDLVNTEVIKRGKQIDLLTTPQDVAHWWQAACRHHPEFDKVRTENENTTNYDMALFKDLKSLRTALRAIFSALVTQEVPDKKDVSILNAVLRTGYSALDLTEQGDLLPCYHTTDAGKGLVLLPIALSALRLIRSGDRKRLHHCENGNCILFFYDTTKSATRRWCSLGCMDRARSAQRYREAKQRQAL